MISKALRRKPLLVGAAISLALLATACGSDSSSSEDTTAASAAPTSAGSAATTAAASGGSTPSGDTCVDGDKVELGLLNSTSGVMAISEQTVRDSLLMAVDEINAGGGILGKQIDVIEE